MNILIVSFTFPPNKDGVAEAVSTMVGGLLSQGWNVSIATSPTTPSRQSLEYNGARIAEFDISGSGHPRQPYKGQLDQYFHFTEGQEWDLVIFHSYVWSFPFSKAHLRKLSGHKIIVGHGYSLIREYSPKFPWGLGTLLWSLIQSWKMAWWLHYFDRAVYLSPRISFDSFFDHLIATITNHRGRVVIPNGIDLSATGSDPLSFRAKLDISEDQILILCVANYSPLKNQGFAVRAFRKAAISNSVMVFVGSKFNEWSEKFISEDQGHQGESNKIIWLEKQSREETLNAFSSCDMFVLSSTPEAQGLVILEAMREKKPWIARRTGSIPDLNGGICIDTVQEMANAMSAFAADSNLREELGRMGRNDIERRYNHRSYIDAYIKLIRTTMARTLDK